MYYPYFRGKQNELITIRENAQLLKKSGFVPIIEPVKSSFGGLDKAISAIIEVDAEAIIIVNPFYGDHSHSAKEIVAFFEDGIAQNGNISCGILLTADISVREVVKLCAGFNDRLITLVHAGFTETKLLVEGLGDSVSEMRHIFVEDDCGKLYRRHFQGGQRVLLRDGFEKRTNRKHPSVEFFSDLHITYEEEGVKGFGDFLIVGNDYTEGGGPAYAIAIHLTFIDSNNDDAMFIHHFKSIRQNDPKDPAGKFAEALDKMVKEINRSGSNILKTKAVQEFLDLHKRKHYPGLGYVKKLSMQHHIETLANYFETTR